MPSKTRPTLTLADLHQALQPPNNCRVRLFRDRLDEESRNVFDEACGYDRKDLPSARLRELLLEQGFSEADVPGLDAINDHRVGRRPCRCRG